MLAIICRYIVDHHDARLLCPPAWTAHVGQRWDTFDVSPWNLYNVLWRGGQWVFKHTD
jgi:hypothetical protein